VAAATQFDTDGRIGREELQSALRSLNGVRVADATVGGDYEVGRLFDFAQRHLKVKITQLGYH
jgi:calmodulin